MSAKTWTFVHCAAVSLLAVRMAGTPSCPRLPLDDLGLTDGPPRQSPDRQHAVPTRVAPRDRAALSRLPREPEHGVRVYVLNHRLRRRARVPRQGTDDAARPRG